MRLKDREARVTDGIQASECARMVALKAQGREYCFMIDIRSHKGKGTCAWMS